MTDKYTCNFAGTCELDVHGYSTQEECIQQCRPVEAKDLIYLMLSYNLRDLEDLEKLAPSDRLRLIREITGLSVQLSPPESYRMLVALVHRDVQELVTYPQLVPYLIREYPPEELAYYVWGNGGEIPHELVTYTSKAGVGQSWKAMVDSFLQRRDVTALQTLLTKDHTDGLEGLVATNGSREMRELIL